MLTRHYTTLPLQSASSSGPSHDSMMMGRGAAGGTDPAEGMFQKKRKVIHFVLRWCVMALHEFTEDPSLISFLNVNIRFCFKNRSFDEQVLDRSLNVHLAFLLYPCDKQGFCNRVLGFSRK